MRQIVGIWAGEGNSQSAPVRTMCFILNGWPGGQRKDRIRRPNLSVGAVRRAPKRRVARRNRGCASRRGGRLGCSRRLEAVASHVFRGLGAIAAEFHAAPAAGGVFGGVVKVQDAAFALAQAARVEAGEQIGGGVQERREKIRWFPRVEAVLLFQNSLGENQLRGQGMLREQAIECAEHSF